MKYPFASFFALVLLLSGCSQDDEAGNVNPDYTVEINFTPYYMGEVMELQKRYNNVHDCTFLLTQFKFYLANITLHGDGGVKRMLSDIELIDFPNQKHTLRYHLDGGSYNAISFDIGVPVELNGTENPNFLTSVYALSHPLGSSQGTYWTWQTGYRFFMADGRYDTIPNSTAEIMQLFTFHTGLDTLFRNVEAFPRSINRGRGEFQLLEFALDFEKFWQSPAGEIDLRIEHGFHGEPREMELGIRVADNTTHLFRLIP